MEAGCGEVGYSPSAGASSSSLTMVSISPDFSPVLVFTKKYFMKTFGATAARDDREVAKPPSGAEGAAGSRRERISDVEVQHCHSIVMLESFNALCDYRPTRKQDEGGGRRLALGTTALRSPPMHRRTAFGGKSLGFSVKRRESCVGP